MEARIVRDELQKCYRGEGVNQLQNCKALAEKYAAMIRDNKVGEGIHVFWEGVGIWKAGTRFGRYTGIVRDVVDKRLLGPACLDDHWLFVSQVKGYKQVDPDM